MTADKARRDQAIYEAIRAIPRGRVATYGQIAELAGLHRGHRLVAAALRTRPDDVPWQRVVGNTGRAGPRSAFSMRRTPHASAACSKPKASHLTTAA